MNVIYVTVCLSSLIWALWFIYVIPPSDHLHPSMKGIWLPLRDGFLQCVCVSVCLSVCLNTKYSLPVVYLTVFRANCWGTDSMDTNTCDSTVIFTSYGCNCLERSAGLFFHLWQHHFPITFCESRTTVKTHTDYGWNSFCIMQNHPVPFNLF